jgi:hypothetical protein
MKLRILFLFGWTAWFAPAQEPACHPVEGDRILARDLAAALPEFRTAPPEALVGAGAPARRAAHFHARNCARWRTVLGSHLSSPEDVCFEWPSQPLDRARVIAAMQESLQFPAPKSKSRTHLRPRAGGRHRVSARQPGDAFAHRPECSGPVEGRRGLRRQPSVRHLGARGDRRALPQIGRRGESEGRPADRGAPDPRHHRYLLSGRRQGAPDCRATGRHVADSFDCRRQRTAARSAGAAQR